MLAALAGLASTWLQSKTAKENTDRTNQANKELAEYSYSKDLEAWNRQNEYNLPSSQMARLKEAGLNPNLVYGNGAGQTTAAQMPKYNAPTMSYNYKPALDPLAMIGAYQNFKIQNAQYDNLKAQNNVIQQEALTKVITNKYLGDKMFRSNAILGQQIDLMANQLGWQMSGGENNIKDSNLWKGLNADLSFRQGRADQQRAATDQMIASTALKGKELEFFDWGAWSRLLQGFGVKLPSFRR